MGNLERVPVPHANAVSIHFSHKTEKNRKETTAKIVKERNCEQELIRLSPGLTEEGMLAKAKDMIM